MKAISKHLFLLICILGGITGCAKKEYHVENGIVFNTYYQIKYESTHALQNKIEAELEKFNLSLNPFNPNSIIAKVNRNEEVEVDAWFTEVFNKATEVSEKTNGAFDITCAPLINLWGFGFSRMDSVTPNMVDSIKTFVGYKKVKLVGKKVVKEDPRILLNCSAIAKGFACDVIARLFKKEGVENYMINIGGEIVMKGKNDKNAYWRIEINNPEDDDTSRTKNEHEKVVVQLCKEGAIATSGDYLNFYIKDGKKYAHTINPQTGYPAMQNILSATIVADNCITADAYATAFMVMGIDSARLVAASVPEIDYFIIYAGENGKQLYESSTEMLNYFPSK